ncbi:MAG: hypothetical protein HY870_14280, partial [Chloroflexi bacterium]|nr:hypothetical protein [Chloroflexota bacterium]
MFRKLAISILPAMLLLFGVTILSTPRLAHAAVVPASQPVEAASQLANILGDSSPRGSQNSHLDINVAGVITQSTTWTLAGSPYTLTGDLVVGTGVTLTVEPGVVVKGQSGTTLQMLGHLQALGTASQPITFTSATDTGPFEWGGLLFDGGTGYLRYATVRYGGNH